jgi:putative tricarboxylic transport membrane protein
MNERAGTANGKKFTVWISNQNAALWFGLAFLAWSILFFKMSFDISYYSKLGAGPGMYPRWLSGISILIAILYIWQSRTMQIFKFGYSFPGKRELVNVAAVFIACLIFIFLLNRVGFNIAGTLLLFVMFMRQYKLWQALFLSMTITFLHYFIFKICFSVPLPETFLGLIGS